MNSLESVRKLLEDFLQESSTYDEHFKLMLIVSNSKFHQRIYEAFSNLIADSSQTPDDIVLRLEAYTSGLDGLSTNRPIQSLIAYACLGSLARRQPKILTVTGPWETLLWIVIKYSSFTGYSSLFTVKNIKSPLFIVKTNIGTVHWIVKMGSQQLCPNPCIRLELFRLMRSLNYFHVKIDQKSFRDKVIITLLEISDNYTSLTVSQVPNFCPKDLKVVMEDNKISMGYLMNDQDLYMNKSKIIAAVLKLTRMFALLEKEKQMLDPTPLHTDLNSQLSACLSFCGLLPIIPDDDLDDDDCMLFFIQEVSNDPLLVNYMVDTLDTITQISLCFPEDVFLQKEIRYVKGRMLRRFFKNHIKNVPKHQYIQEIYCGNTPAKEYTLRYFQNKMVSDYVNDYDSDLL